MVVVEGEGWRGRRRRRAAAAASLVGLLALLLSLSSSAFALPPPPSRDGFSDPGEDDQRVRASLVRDLSDVEVEAERLRKRKGKKESIR